MNTNVQCSHMYMSFGLFQEFDDILSVSSTPE